MALKEHGFKDNKDVYDLAEVVELANALKLKEAFPKGSVFMTFDNRNPNAILGYGTWSKIGGDTFLCSTGANESAGGTGGSNSKALTTSNMPSHNHKSMVRDTSKDNDVTYAPIPVGWRRRGGLGPAAYQIGASDEAIYGNVDINKRGTTADDSGSYLVWRPKSVQASDPNLNFDDGKLYLVNGLKNLKKRGSASPCVSFPYEANPTTNYHSDTDTRTGTIGSSTPFDNRPSFIKVNIWRRTA